jgi:hypothetical protein
VNQRIQPILMHPLFAMIHSISHCLISPRPRNQNRAPHFSQFLIGENLKLHSQAVLLNPLHLGMSSLYTSIMFRTPTMQGMTSGSLLSDESPAISTPLEMMKQSQRPPSRSMVDSLRGKNASRSFRETVQVGPFPLSG